MPITSLDKNTALVLIDLQKGIVNLPLAHPVNEVLANASRLLNEFHKLGLPVIIVNVSFASDGGDTIKTRNESKFRPTYPDGWNEITPEIKVLPGDIRVTKHNWNAFYGTDLDLQLRRRGITGIVLAGISTSIGVEGTARGAHERNYNIAFASDAMTDMNKNAHENSLSVIFPRMGEIDTTQAILAKLNERGL